jgi:large subunit ribosomal protein L17
MKKRIAFRKLGRQPTHKWAMLRNMVTSLIKHERIVTTLPKAKELRKLADKVVGLGKNGELRCMCVSRHIVVLVVLVVV